MTKPFTPPQVTAIAYEDKAIGAEALRYKGSSTTVPADSFEGAFYVKTAATYGIYLYTSHAWVRQTSPTNEMVSLAAYDIMIAVNAGNGTITDYIASGNNFQTALIQNLFATYIKVLAGGSLRGGDRYGEGGTVVSALVDGWWLGAGSAAGFLARARGLDLTFCNTAGTVVGHLGPDNLLFDTSDFNTSVGYFGIPESATGDYNVAFGYSCLQNLTTGAANVAIGYEALQAIISGADSIAIGTQALKNSAGGGNIAIGRQSLFSSTSGSNNVALGNNALEFQNGIWNVSVGMNAMKGVSGSVGIPSANVALGFNSLQNLQSGDYNNGIGLSSLDGLVTGSNNIAIGYQAASYSTAFSNIVAIGYQSLRLNDGDNNTALGYLAGDTATTETNITCLGKNAQITGSNQVQLGDSATTTYAYGAVQNRSDKRDKADIRPTELGLQFIEKLLPVDYKWDYREDYSERVEKDGKVEVIEHKKDGSKKRKRYHHGFIAQDVKQTIDELGVDFGGYQDHKLEGGKDVLSLGYQELIAPMVKAIQEQQEMINELKDRIYRLEGGK